MKTRDFWYDLPEELIAQTPVAQRDSSRLLVMDRRSGQISHNHFFDIVDYLKDGDCLVMNDSRVLPARLLGNRPTGGAVELLLLKDLGDKKWECLAKPGRKLQAGQEVIFGDGKLTATIQEVQDDGNRVVEFHYDGIFLEILEQLGKMPLPPYIKAELKNQERYQTVYSREIGSAAAPTAGLHFTNELLDEIRARGAQIVNVTLHVGAGTWLPVKTEDLSMHKMHSEWCCITSAQADIINNAKRVIAVGTTSMRTLESAAMHNSDSGKYRRVMPFCQSTNIFITPGYKFRAVDVLLTNFHLPKSTLFMLVSAFSGLPEMKSAYKHAVDEKYRFFSYGDCCLLFKKDISNEIQSDPA